MYFLELSKSVADFLRKSDKLLRERIINKLEELKQNPEIGKPLTGNLSGLWSLRIGDYRAIYQVFQNKMLILLLKLGHRKQIYD